MLAATVKGVPDFGAVFDALLVDARSRSKAMAAFVSKVDGAI
jgi:hypothetical protein